jgi:quinolinate synthase
MVRRVRESKAPEFIVATETGMLHRLRKENPHASFIPADRAASCHYVKMITPEKLLDSLRHERFEVTVAPEIIERARVPIERMIAIG